jgi:hypothetical protein
MTTRLGIALLAAGLLALGGCGNTDDDGGVASLGGGAASAAPSAGTAADVEKEVNAYVECLRKQGLDVPDPTVDENGQVSFGRLLAGSRNVDRDKFEAAQKVCGKPPAGITSGIQDTLNSPEFQDAAVKFAKCMREQGVDLPDPDFSQLGGGSGNGGLFGGIDRDDPKVAAAIEACKDVWAGAGLAPRTGGSGN